MERLVLRNSCRHRRPLPLRHSMCRHVQFSATRSRRPAPRLLFLALVAALWFASFLCWLAASDFSLPSLADQVQSPYSFCAASFDAVAATLLLVLVSPLVAPRLALAASVAIGAGVLAKPICAAATSTHLPPLALSTLLCASATVLAVAVLSLLRVLATRRAAGKLLLEEQLLAAAAAAAADAADTDADADAAATAAVDDEAAAHASLPQPTLLSRLTFAWVWPLLRRGAAKQLEQNALEPLWHEDDLHHVGPWGRDWEADKRWRPLFVRRCGRLFLLQSACRLASDAAMVAQPSNPNP